MSISLPVWLVAGTIQMIWPSRFLPLKRCLLREAAVAGGQEPLMPMSPRAQLGTSIHAIFERAATDPSFPAEPARLAAEWKKMLAAAEHNLSAMPYMQTALPLTRSIPNLGLIRSRTLIALADIRASARPSRATPASAHSSAQGKLSNKAGTVVGIPDLISHTSEGTVISDFKTGTFLQPDGSVYPDYQAQLQLYAALYHENYNTWPVRLEIISITGARIPVPAAPAECQKLLGSAHRLCLKARNVTSALAANPHNQTQAASPRPETCQFCPFRPRCPAYLTSALSGTPLCQCDVAGTLQRWSTSGNGAIFVDIQSKTGCIRVRSVAPAAPILSVLNFSSVGDKILVVNLKHDTPNLHTATNYTAIHTYRQTLHENPTS